ncbi:MAG: xylulose kinase [Spirochaetia bacterium]|nr:xylulose kinase [Spirochaetia bacterium]
MARRFVIGVDIGTQGVKAVLFSEDGEALSSSFVPSKLQQPKTGVVEEDPDFQVYSVCSAIQECVFKAGKIKKADIACIAIDGQMAGILGVGSDGKAVTPYDSWLDTRCTPYIEVMREKAEEAVTLKTGNPPSLNHGPKILWWKNERPDVYAEIASFVQPAGYAAMQLCGLSARQSFIDTTYLHFSGYANNPASEWDAELLAIFSMDNAKMPEIVSPFTIVGGLTKEMAERCGLEKSVPVAAGCGDTAASFLSCGAVQSGVCVDVAGTASVFAATTDAFCPDIEMKILGCGASVTPGLWHPYAYINGGGMNLEWFAAEILKKDKNNDSRFDSLLPAELSPKMTDPLFLPHMGGRVSPSQPHLRGTFAGLNWKHNDKDLFMAVIESVALEYGIYRKALMHILPDTQLQEMRITGGGARSRIWKMIKSAVLQVPVASIAEDYGAPMGAAMVAACAVNIFPSTEAGAKAWVHVNDAFPINAKLIEHYQRRLDMYEKLLSSMDKFYSEFV